MSTILIYHCPIDFHCQKDWHAWAINIASDLRRYRSGEYSYDPPFAIEIEPEPFFTYGKQRPNLDELTALRPKPRVIAIRCWSSIVFYSAAAILIGDGIEVNEVKGCLNPLPLLNEYRDGFQSNQIRLFMYGCGTEIESKARQIINSTKDFVYIVKHWDYLTEGQDTDWILHFEPSNGVYVIDPKDDRHDNTFWSHRLENSLICVPRHSNFIDALVLSLDDFDDLQLILGKWRVKEPIITFKRCHADDCYLCTYNMPPLNTANQTATLVI